MKNKKINEIIKKLQDRNWYNSYDLTGTCWVELTWEEAHSLIDFINILLIENKTLMKHEDLINNELKECRKYKIRVKNLNRYILDNFSNNDNSIWHTEMKYIYDYLNRN